MSTLHTYIIRIHNTFALLRNSSDLHFQEDLYGERNKPEKNTLLNYNKNRLPKFQRRLLCVSLAAHAQSVTFFRLSSPSRTPTLPSRNYPYGLPFGLNMSSNIQSQSSLSSAVKMAEGQADADVVRCHSINMYNPFISNALSGLLRIELHNRLRVSGKKL